MLHTAPPVSQFSSLRQPQSFPSVTFTAVSPPLSFQRNSYSSFPANSISVCVTIAIKQRSNSTPRTRQPVPRVHLDRKRSCSSSLSRAWRSSRSGTGLTTFARGQGVAAVTLVALVRGKTQRRYCTSDPCSRRPSDSTSEPRDGSLYVRNSFAEKVVGSVEYACRVRVLCDSCDTICGLPACGF